MSKNPLWAEVNKFLEKKNAALSGDSPTREDYFRYLKSKGRLTLFEENDLPSSMTKDRLALMIKTNFIDVPEKV